MKRWLYRIGFVVALAFLLLTFLNASWIADAPAGKVKLVAHRAMAQLPADPAADAQCNIAEIEPLLHRFIPGSVAALEEAKPRGAAMVEVDVARTADGQVVAFPDVPLECLTDGEGAVSDLTLAELKALDAGYRYTPDGGKTYPLRGEGVGAIASMDELFARAERKPLMFRLSGSDPALADALVAELKAAGRDPVRRSDGFFAPGEAGPVARMRELLPEAWVFSTERAAGCDSAYRLWGWIGITPSACRDNTLIVPLDAQGLPGWPNRAIARMEDVGARIVMVAPGGTSDLSGITLPEQLGEVPASYNGFLWVDDMWSISPALFPSTDKRSEAQLESARAVHAARRDR